MTAALAPLPCNPGRRTVPAPILLFALCLLAVLLRPVLPWLSSFPSGWHLPITTWVADWAVPATEALVPAGRAVAAISTAVLSDVQAILQWLPWPSVVFLIAILALRASGWGLAAFTTLGLGAIVLAGYWPQTMNTLAIVLIALPVAVLSGFAIGAAAHWWPRLASPVEALLDLMQTVPAFAYLIPLLLVFGFGPAAGIAACIVFAVPPMARNALLGLSLVPTEQREAAHMSGATPRQLFWLAEVPAAWPRLMVGINQTTMASLSMVIIVAIIGGFDDIGWEVLSAMRSAEMGRSLVSGLVIVVMAIVLDRITLGLAAPRDRARRLGGRGLLYGSMAALGLAVALRSLLPDNDLLPDTTARVLTRWVDELLLAFVSAASPLLASVENAITYGLLLPLRIGFAGSASPLVWGFAFEPWMAVVYAAVVLGAAAAVARLSRAAGLAILFAGLAFYTGLPAFPWPAAIACLTILAWSQGGVRLAALALGGLLMILLSGLWLPFAQSVYLCTLAVALCVLLGSTLGILAAHSDRLSTFLRPISDALQTMPQFVFLIPALMLFQVGEFTALIAIALYAVVPPVRYVEQGLRTVPQETLDAARQIGATPWQLLWQVKMPLAGPALRLGLNQTIMAALSMLVIAALVGTRDLGQQVYIALGRADPGLGLVAGLSIALLAMVSDRILRRPAR